MPSWPFLLALVFPAAAIVLWRVWQLDIRPRLLPSAEIGALAALWMVLRLAGLRP